MIGMEELSKRWNIGLDISKKRVKVTTQRGIWTVINPILSRIFSTNDRQLIYRRLDTNISTDTFLSSVNSIQGNTCANIYCNYLRWTRIPTMKSKSKSHHSLSTLFTQDGVTNAMVVDNTIEQTAGGGLRRNPEMQIDVSTPLNIFDHV